MQRSGTHSKFLAGVLACTIAMSLVMGFYPMIASAGVVHQGECTDAETTSGLVTAGSGASVQCVTADSADDVNNTAPTNPTSCEGWSDFFIHAPTCIARSLGSFLAGILVLVTGTLLTIAGAIFDWTLDKTVITFGQFVNQNVITGVNAAWTAFRDIANILIIGIFTFIAIGTILGLSNFNAKKLLARVLLIAVLINFSLLFCKMIVDVSNFVGTQFYNAAQLPSGTATTAGSKVPDGIAGTFMKYAGVTGFTDTKNAVDETSKRLDNGWIGFAQGLFTATMFFIAAGVLLYGSFLLISRGILIIFLMATAAVAFASHLVPKWSDSDYGWDAWWSSLVWCAALAPVMIFFLWMTLTVASAMKVTTGSLGDLVVNPTNANDLSALFSYIVIIGLLFVSFKISGMIAKKIGGFSYAAMPLTLGNRFLAAPLARLAIGGPSYFLGKALAGSAKKSRTEAARAGARAGDLKDQASAAIRRADAARVKSRLAANSGQLSEAFKHDQLARQEDAMSAEKTAAARKAAEKKEELEKKSASTLGYAGMASKVAEGRFNVADTAPIKGALKEAGITGLASGESGKGFYEKSFADQVKTRAEAAEKLASKLAPSKDEIEKEKIEARNRIQEERKHEREEKLALENIARATAELANKAPQEQLKSGEANLRESQKKRENNQLGHDARAQQERESLRATNVDYDAAHRSIEYDKEAKKNIHERFDAEIKRQIATATSGISDPAKRATIEQDIRRDTDAQRASELRHQAQRIDEARVEIQSIESGAAGTALRAILATKASNYGTDTVDVAAAENDIRVAEREIKNNNARSEAAKENRETFDKETRELVKSAADDISNAMRDSAVGIAQKVGEQQGDVLKRVYGNLPIPPIWTQNKAVGDATKDLFKKKGRESKVKDIIADLGEETPPATAAH